MSTLKDDLSSLKIDQSARGGGSGAGAWVAVAVLVLLAAAAGTWAWTRHAGVAEVTAATAVSRGGAGAAPDAVLNGSGYVTARRRATVSSKVTGKVLEVFVEEGQAVRKGQVLARLDDSQVRAALAVAEAQVASARGVAAEDQARLREAELSLQRRQQLLEEGVVGRAEVDTMEAQVESLKARIALAGQQVLVAESQVRRHQTDLADMVVRAPFDGVAISKDAQPGEMISPVSAGGGFTRTGIGTIVDMTSLEIEVDVSESYINRVKPGQPVVAVLDAYPDWQIPARVITTVPAADRQKATVRVRIAFDASTASGTRALDPRILPDMGVKVSFLAEARPASADPPARRLMVPKAAIRKDQDRDVVFVVKGDTVERRAVRVGAADGDQIEVVTGLNDGERVVVDGPATLADGMRIRVKER